MSLQEELEKMKAQQEKEAKPEEEAPQEEPAPKPEKVADREPEEQEEPEQEATPAAPAPEDKKAYNEAMAKMRRELAATKRMLEEAKKTPVQAQPQYQPQQATPQTDEDPEPDVNTNPVEWVKWNTRQTDAQLQEVKAWKEEQSRIAQQTQTVQAAVQELGRYENEFKATAEDYDDVSNFVVGELKRSFKLMHPGASDDQITQAVQRHVLLEASRYAQQGLNPVEEMYWRAKNELGYQPKAPVAEEQEELRPDLDKIAKNKQRSAGMAGTSGSPQRAVPSTKAAAAAMSPREWAKLSAEDKRRIMQMQ